MPSPVSILRAIARKVLPRPVRSVIAHGMSRLEKIQTKAVGRRFKRRSVALPGFEPIFPPREFADGPILMVNNALAPGGVERQIVNSLRELGRRKDHAFGLLCLRLGEEPELDFFKPALADFPGIVRNAMTGTEAIPTLENVISKTSLDRMDRAIEWMPFDVRDQIHRLAAEFAILKPSIVHAWQDGSGIPAAYAARLIGVPRIILSTRNLRPTNFHWYRPHMLYAHRDIAGCPDIILINNSEAGAADYARWLGVPVTRYVIKRNGLDTTTIRRPAAEAVAALRAQLGIPPDAPVVGSIFRFYEEKRPLLWIQTAAEVARRVPDCHFVIFGSGPLQKATEDMASRKGIADRFHCPGTIEDAAIGLSLFDVFLLTSKVEGTPNVVLEASLLGVPVVVTEAGGTRETIAEGISGYLVDPPKLASLANRIVQILTAAPWRARARIEAPAFIEQRFGLRRMIAQTLQLYGLAPD